MYKWVEPERTGERKEVGRLRPGEGGGTGPRREQHQEGPDAVYVQDPDIQQIRRCREGGRSGPIPVTG